MSRSYFAAAGLVVGVVLLINCGEKSSMAPNTSIFGEPERVAGGGNPAETVCQKFESCGLFSQVQASSSLERSDLGLRGFGLTVDAAIGTKVSAMSSPFEPSAPSSDEQPKTMMGVCIKQVEGVIKQVEDQLSTQVDWASVAYCIAAGSCSNFISEDGWQRLGEQCAGQLGVNLGSSSTQPPPNIPNKPSKDAGVDPPPSSGDVCEQAANKLKACIEALDCTSLEGQDKTICDVLKETPIKVNGSCDGENKDAAEQINSCSLDELCRCAL